MRSRVTLAIIGIVLLGGAGGLAGVLSVPRAPASLASLQGNQPTAPATTRATPVSRPRATPGGCSSGQPGQSATLIGSIAGSNAPAQTFDLRRTASGTCTIRVTMVTTYSGGRASFAALQPGDSTEVQGTWQADGSVLATEVNAQPDNN
jgi:hypothetical protein